MLLITEFYQALQWRVDDNFLTKSLFFFTITVLLSLLK